MKKLVFLLLFLSTVSFNSTQKPEAYDVGEWFKFRVHYGFVNAGYATLEVKDAVLNNKKVFFLLPAQQNNVMENNKVLVNNKWRAQKQILICAPMNW